MVSQNSIGNTVADNDFSVNRVLAGTSVVCTIAHSDDSDTSSNAILRSLVEGGSGGDPFVHLKIGAAILESEYSIGIDNTDSDILKITSGATPSAGTDLLTATSVGVVDIPARVSAGGGTYEAISTTLIQGVQSSAGNTIKMLIANNENANAASHAVMHIETNGANGGDPHLLLDIANTASSYAIGIDNSDSDILKITSGATPSSGNTLWSLTSAGAATFNDAFTFPTADGNAGETLKTDGGGNVAWGVTSGTGELIQYQNSVITTVVTCNTAIPRDNTIPQQTEGIEVLTVTITPKSATNKLVLKGNISAAHNGTVGATASVITLFQDATANAIAADMGVNYSPSESGDCSISHTMVAGTTSATTFKMRMGPTATPHILYVNGDPVGNPIFGGVSSSTFEVWEIGV